MAFNNDAFYDAVVAGAGGGAQHGWLVLSTPASYTPFANNIDILATAVDLQIPTIAGGPSVSQINLLQSITQSVLTARYPVPVAPATYVDIAKAIAAVYTELEKLLTNQPTVASYGVNWLVADWYIDGTVGDDANSGVVIGAPLKTGAELLRRLGPYAMWPQSVTVHVLANGMTDALVLRGLMMVAGTHLDVIGTPTQLADAGTVASYTGIVHATPAAPQVSTTLIADWTPYQWRRLRCIAGTADRAVTWIACANPAGAGLSIARTPRWSRIKLTTTPLYEFVNPAVGDSIVIESLPPIPSITLLLDGPLPLAKSPLYTNRQWLIDSVDCQQISTAGTALAAFGLSSVIRSVTNQIQRWGHNWDPGTASFRLGCLVVPSDTSGSTTAVVTSQGNNIGCLFGGKPAIQLTSYSNQQVQLNSCLFQDCRLTLNGYAYASCFETQLFDITSATTGAIIVNSQAVIRLQGVSGANNAGYEFSVAANTNIDWSNSYAYNLVALTGGMRFSNAPVFVLTSAQGKQSSDYAQKGISGVMVAGTITITVPWYDNVIQKVTVSHAVFAGTPGILSVQQISNTQFTITSSSALDTSTVNWSISPLGRNIFINTT